MTNHWLCSPLLLSLKCCFASGAQADPINSSLNPLRGFQHWEYTEYSHDCCHTPHASASTQAISVRHLFCGHCDNAGNVGNLAGENVMMGAILAQGHFNLSLLWQRSPLHSFLLLFAVACTTCMSNYSSEPVFAFVPHDKQSIVARTWPISSVTRTVGYYLQLLNGARVSFHLQPEAKAFFHSCFATCVVLKKDFQCISS